MHKLCVQHTYSIKINLGVQQQQQFDERERELMAYPIV